ncbi:ketopantoate reductase family protein [Marinobacterium sediminicola]|uniref:2-dehydropantoate 2-reductase n=1 Tax=Marinobacterium sediminicola TaxID=518898 RepID=A0ABY1RWC3_9GAMM|nr:2-dehydropantoate 2-reductase [Marinobacterium sediminicola]ULG70357.1 2-dehydropantoate 2-reductase [Marinobacterium sediminicola]SMR69621.1 2-dehydropantoate 2-reductase [Marinobacterium sediminicola]
MKFLIIGAGGIGCYYGARLLDAGHEVTFIARGAHLEAMKQQGLSVEHEALHFKASVEALSMDELLNRHNCADYDLVMLALKSGATSDWLSECGHWLKQAETPVLSLQNGVDNEPLIAAVIGEERTLGGLAVRIGGHIIAPGHIEAKGPAQVVMGRWPQVKESVPALDSLSDTLNAAQIPTRITNNIRYELWKKLLINNGVNPLSALTGLDTRSLTADPALGKTVYAMMQETALAARADDVELTPSDVDEMFALISQFDAIKTSMLVDREKGRPLELDDISGAVIRRCRQLGESAPNTELVERLLQLDIRPVQWRPLTA